MAETRARSKEMAKSMDRFHQLYEDWHIQEARRKSKGEQYLQEECPFVPKITKIKGGFNDEMTQNFMRRLQKDIAERKLKRHRLMAERYNADKIDNSTGQQLFKPIVSQAPRALGCSVGEHLYQESKIRNIKKAELLADQRKELERTQKQSCNDKSAQLLEEKKKKIFNELFDSLDGDHDGKIAPGFIEVLGVQDEILLILAPLFCELDEINREIERHEFLYAIGKLYNVLSSQNSRK